MKIRYEKLEHGIRLFNTQVTLDREVDLLDLDAGFKVVSDNLFI
jgi:hypothetical protein